MTSRQRSSGLEHAGARTSAETGWSQRDGETGWSHDAHRSQIISVNPKETRLHGAEEPRIFTENKRGYIEPTAPPTGPTERFRDPRALVEHVNPHFGEGPEYSNNCADCARAFESSWRGYGVEAAGRRGELTHVTEQWAHETYAPTDPDALYRQLREAGPGASAIVVTHWDTPGGSSGGHAYNVVNHEGRILVADAQRHEVLDYSPATIMPLLEGQTITSQRAMAWNAGGERIDVRDPDETRGAAR
ncbi:hypothetical protein JS528_10790 [Bifidobacterium sp. MA2]|uniref:Tox-PL domain-containing protein n=1 Tax=Bifidobacterium santillanense TaxID=2809028 RepID=A0ABS5USJ9_9BIFI|nr:toxin glutamine deamidase domain-containing protein [Bifidobacterium santillanense]MBT1173810.1 hypothetical protein [Bifidobacterium santillanense]